MPLSRNPHVMSPVWLALWAISLSIAWLMPNHFPPWSSFHADAWMAIFVAIGALAPLLRVRSGLQWSTLPCVAIGLVLVPWVQFGVGLVPFAGQAWMSSAYLLGFAAAMLVGARWEMASPDELASGLVLAVATAATLSVWLELYTWLGLWGGGVEDIWSMGYSGARPYANLGQPNQLATLLIWGVLACLWAYVAGILSAATSVVAAGFFLIGLALTQSRTGVLALTAVLLAVWFWRRLWPSSRTPWVASGLYGFFLACPFLLQFLRMHLLLGQENSYDRLHEQGDLRLGAWRLFAHAVLERPWFGYGWTELGAAQMTVADRFPGVNTTFGHAHNLFLDLFLWNGVPLGLTLSLLVVMWFLQALRRVDRPKQAVLVMLLAAVGIHAMVELPLHYAYFLLPSGLFIGIVHTSLGSKVIWTTPRWTLGILWLSGALVLSLIVRDYFHVEASYNALRFEQARIGIHKAPPGEPPDVVLLTHMREWFRLARYNVHAGMSKSEIDWMAAVSRTFPSAAGAYRMAMALALNGRPDEALLWLKKICKITTEQQCRSIRRAWVKETAGNARLEAIHWPSE